MSLILGQFESFLFQRGSDQVLTSIKKCWCSCFSERVMSHRLELGMNTTGLKMAVIVQVHTHVHVHAYTCIYDTQTN